MTGLRRGGRGTHMRRDGAVLLKPEHKTRYHGVFAPECRT
jgi:hypothetical protein